MIALLARLPVQAFLGSVLLPMFFAGLVLAREVARRWWQ